MTKDQMVDSTVKAINAYCRVLELHMKAVAQGGSPLIIKGTPAGKMMSEAQEGLAREVTFLRFLREEGTEGKPDSHGG